jgi:hypothetical protein
MVKLWDWDEKDQPIDDYLTNCNEFNNSHHDFNFMNQLIRNSYIHSYFCLHPGYILIVIQTFITTKSKFYRIIMVPLKFPNSYQ